MVFLELAIYIAIASSNNRLADPSGCIMMGDYENLTPRSNSSSRPSYNYALYTDYPAAAQIVGKAAAPAADSSQQTRRYDDRQQAPLSAYLQRRKDRQALPPVYLRRVNYPTPQAIVRKVVADISLQARRCDDTRQAPLLPAYLQRRAPIGRTDYPATPPWPVVRKAAAAAGATKQTKPSEDRRPRDSEDKQANNSKDRQTKDSELDKHSGDKQIRDSKDKQTGGSKGRETIGLITMNLSANQVIKSHSQGRPQQIRNFEPHTRSVYAITQREEIVITFNGFIDIMYETKKLPYAWSFSKSTIYKMGLFVYFFLNFMYSVFAASVQGGQHAYCLVYMSISLIGFIFEFNVMIITINKCLTQCCNVKDGKIQRSRDDEQVQDSCHKGKSVFIDYVISSIGEFLIYPTLICVMYGFINERSWQFDNKIHVCNLILLVYSVIMDALYMKFYVIWLVIRVLCASYAKYNELLTTRKSNLEWYRFSVYLILLAIFTALTHWLMTAIIGVRIYVDNFTTEKDVTNDTNSSIPNTGDYRIAPLTGYMIGCTIYLPIVSWIFRIILYYESFYKIYSAIHRLNTGVDHVPSQNPWKDNGYLLLLLPYFTTVFLFVPFIAFTVGSYLPDYNSSEYEVASSARIALQALGACFIVFFLLFNFEVSCLTICICIIMYQFILIFVVITIINIYYTGTI